MVFARSASLESTHQLTYSLHDASADIHAENIRMENGSYQFNVVTRLWKLNDITLNMGGLHNVENVIAAIMIAHHLGIADDKIKAAVADFKGVKRRFEYMIKNT